MLAELKGGYGVVIMIDQWAGSEGVWTDFFGIPTSTTSLPARLAQRTGCALIPAFCRRKGDGFYEIQVMPAIYAHADDGMSELLITEKLNRWLEDRIRQFPEQWLWVHRRWKERPSLRVPRSETRNDYKKVS